MTNQLPVARRLQNFDAETAALVEALDGEARAYVAEETQAGRKPQAGRPFAGNGEGSFGFAPMGNTMTKHVEEDGHAS